MPTNHRAALAAIKRFDQLIAYLRDEMYWPIDRDDFEELTFEYTPDELGIDTHNAAKIQNIKRLRPLTTNQPWGVFFVKFEPKRLPVMALRSILGRVALKKRASANSAERQAWDAEDLLFVSNYGEGETRQISFAHFAASAESRDLPTLKVFGWDDRDTALHLDHVVHELTKRLAWPEDDTDADAWREQWRAAFTLRHREVITTAQELSIRLAALARAIRGRTHAALEIETENGRITQLMEAFREGLIHDLDVDGFADMVAQTIAYGLLSARIADPQQETAADLASHMRTNPLLRDLMTAFLQADEMRSATEIDFDELGVSEVVELLDNANMEAVLRDFGDRNPREDPVIHFYEDFLTEYDKQKKVERGVFYTPRPVVSYIVRSVDALLRSEFGLEDGLADTTTWGEMAQLNKDLTIPEGVLPDQDFVQILDPATGTGTFLVEVIDLIHKTLREKWQAQGHNEKQVKSLWNEYVSKHLLPRLHGYELLMAPYSIAHLKIGLKLYETGYRFGSDERAHVYLTNALEPAHDYSGVMDFAIPALAHEVQKVNEVKVGKRFTVLIGNPPYSGISSNMTEYTRRLVDSYKFVDGKPLKERKHWLQDDYVKFMRLAQVTIEAAGIGALGYITNHGYLDNPTFRGMRQSLMATFSCLRLLNLHGNANKKEHGPNGSEDKNVFDIRQGVAICLATRGSKETGVFHADMWGAREAKYSQLVSNDLVQSDYSALTLSGPYYFFEPRNMDYQEEYKQGWKISEVMPLHSAGFITARDHFVVDFDHKDLLARIEEFSDLQISDQEIRATYFAGRGSSKYPDGDTRGWKLPEARKCIANDDHWRHHVRKCTYRPFDKRYVYWAKWMVDWPRPEVMRHMLAGENIGLSTTRSTEIAEGWEHVFISKNLTQHHTVSLKEVNYLFPLYKFPPEALANVVNREPNLDPKFTQAFKSNIGLDFIIDGIGDLAVTFGPEDIFHYLYAVLHSPEYRRRYADFPRVPLPGNHSLFIDLCRPGARLVSLHLLEVESTEASTTFPIIGSNKVDKVRYTLPMDGLPGRVWINSTQYFDGVDPATYAFAIGGYRPAEKWLKDRKARTLSEDDVAQYKKIIAALTETKELMAEVDNIIDMHGGWPEAFQVDKAESTATEIIPFRPRMVEPRPEERYVTCVPFIPLRAAAGTFSGPQYVEEDGNTEWVAIDSRHRLRGGMFVAQVVGQSMEPTISDGAYCLFRSPVEGTRQGKIVLVQLRDATDPETGQRYTVKRYESQKSEQEDSWHHTRIALKPVNPDFEPIVLTGTDEGELQVIAELVEVLEGKV